MTGLNTEQHIWALALTFTHLLQEESINPVIHNGVKHGTTYTGFSLDIHASATRGIH
jgi:hypothetical protein